MARTATVLLLCLAATALAHSGDHSEDNTMNSIPSIIPFNPSDAPNFASTGSLDYHLTTTSTAEHSSKSSARSHSSISTSAPASSTSTSRPQTTPSSTPTPTTQPVATSTTQTVPEVSGTGAARVNYPEYIGAVAGGLIAGLALV